MPIPLADLPRIKRVCIHEAAHLIVAKEMKFTTNGINLSVTDDFKHDGSIGITLTTSGMNTLAHVQLYLKRRLKVLYAGVIAEFTDQVGNYNSIGAEAEWRSGGGTLDNAKIRELIQVLRHISHPDTNDNMDAYAEASDLRNALKEETRNIITERYAVIEAVANALLEKISAYNVPYQITEQEISEIDEVINFLEDIED